MKINTLWTRQSTIVMLAALVICQGCGRPSNSEANAFETTGNQSEKARSRSAGEDPRLSSRPQTWPSIACDVFSIDSQHAAQIAAYPKKNEDNIQLILSSGARMASSSTNMELLDRAASSVLIKRTENINLLVTTLKTKYGAPDEVQQTEEDDMSPTFQTTRRTRVRISYGPLSFLSWGDEDAVHNITMPLDLFLELDDITKPDSEDASN